MLRDLSLVFVVVIVVTIAFLRVKDYIRHGKDSFLVYPNPNLLYTKQNLAKEVASFVVVDLSSGDVSKSKGKFSRKWLGISVGENASSYEGTNEEVYQK